VGPQASNLCNNTHTSFSQLAGFSDSVLTQETLDVVHYHDAHRAFRAVREYLGNGLDLLGLGKADHVVWRDQLDEWKRGRLRDRRCECGLASPRRAMKQKTDEWSTR
jgi:hypothetical protein